MIYIPLPVAGHIVKNLITVRRQRESKQLTQEKLAEKAGLDPTYISGIERGPRNPGIQNVVKLAKAPGLTRLFRTPIESATEWSAGL